MTNQTPLNTVHREMGAKMVDFGGWDMPLHYGSQIEEHHCVRKGAGMFDVSHMLAIDLTGNETRSFLRTLLANDIDRLQTTGKALYSCMLNDQGGVIDDLIIYFLREDWFRMVVNAGTADKDLAWLTLQQQKSAVPICINPRRDLAMIAVQGPQARGKVWDVLPQVRAASETLKPFQAIEVADYFIARTGYTGEDGFEIMLPATEASALWKNLHQHGVAPIGLGARDTLRLEAGMNLYGQDMDEQTNPLEAGLGWTIPLQDQRNFIGRAALLEQIVQQRMLGLVLVDKGVLRGHQVVRTAHGDGEITSGTFSPTLGKSIAMARLPIAVMPGDTVKVEIRDRALEARVVKYPFVRNGENLIQ